MPCPVRRRSTPTLGNCIGCAKFERFAGCTKQGSRIRRWALTAAIQRIPRDCVIGAVKDGIIARRGKEAKNIAKVAAARRLLTLVFYGMRDGQVRCLSAPAADPAPAQAA
jgi:hypothetical protein